MITLAEIAGAYRALGEHLSRTNIYFIQAGDGGPIKIGVARDPLDRLKTLQTGNHVPLRLLAVWHGYALEEKQLHEQFAAARIAGEWFEPVPDLLLLIEGFRELCLSEELGFAGW